jgi:putative tryptophan/tyrosine transport system substrate-binding protein
MLSLAIDVWIQEYVEGGGPMAYTPNDPGLDRCAAVYVDKILKGANPADLPVEQPMSSSWSST